jgi:membrane-bound serine protease (ClpP class)
VARRTLSILLIAVAAWSAGAVAVATSHDAPVVVIDVENPLDQRLLDFLTDTVRSEDAHLFILKVDSPGISSGDPSALYEAVAESATPVVVWVGDRPAVAYGGAATLLNVADLGAAAPGTRIGYLDPTVVRDQVSPPELRPGHGDPDAAEAAAASLRAEAVTVDGEVPGFIDVVVPSVGQLIVGIDGVEIGRGDEVLTIETARVETNSAGAEVTVPNREVRFLKPGLWDRSLRLASRPESTFFFLAIGIVAAVFEFYAAGVGVTAAVSVLSLFLAGYGMATLPMRWPAVAAVLAGFLFATWDSQRGRWGWRSFLGIGLVLVGGLTFTDAAPQFAPSWWVVLLVTGGVIAFYAVGLPTIVRSRFSTDRIGRDHLVGSRGSAESDFDPDGVVVVEGARWRARSHREAGIRAGDDIEVLEVKGIVLEVGPAPTGVRE